MDRLTIYQKARGEFVRIILSLMVVFAAIYCFHHAPKVVGRKFMKKTVVVRMTYLPSVIEGVGAAAILYMFYVILLAKTSKIEASRVNLSYSRGLFDRRKDALDLTGIQDFTQEQTILDMILKVYTFTIYSRDKTDPNLTLRGIGKADASSLYEHLTVYSNRSIVKYVQSRNERDEYRKKYHSDSPNRELEYDVARYTRPRPRTDDDEGEND